MQTAYSNEHCFRFILSKYYRAHQLPSNPAIAVKFEELKSSRSGLSWKAWVGPSGQPSENLGRLANKGGIEVRGYPKSDYPKSNECLFQIIASLEDGFEFVLDQIECSTSAVAGQKIRLLKADSTVAIKYRAKSSGEKRHCRIQFVLESQAELFHKLFTQMGAANDPKPITNLGVSNDVSNRETWENSTRAFLPMKQALTYYLGPSPANGAFKRPTVDAYKENAWTFDIHEALLDPEFELFLDHVNYLWRSQC